MNSLFVVGAALGLYWLLGHRSGAAPQPAASTGTPTGSGTGTGQAAARNVRLTDAEGQYLRYTGSALERRDGSNPQAPRGWGLVVNAWSATGERVGTYGFFSPGMLEEITANGASLTGVKRPVSDFYE